MKGLTKKMRVLNSLCCCITSSCCVCWVERFGSMQVPPFWLLLWLCFEFLLFGFSPHFFYEHLTLVHFSPILQFSIQINKVLVWSKFSQSLAQVWLVTLMNRIQLNKAHEPSGDQNSSHHELHGLEPSFIFPSKSSSKNIWTSQANLFGVQSQFVW